MRDAVRTRGQTEGRSISASELHNAVLLVAGTWARALMDKDE